MRARTSLALLLAVLASCQPSTPAESVRPSPSLSELTRTPSPSASQRTSPAATATAPGGTQFGIVAAGGLRAESQAEPFATLDARGVAVSPDGRSLAYWHVPFGTRDTTGELRVVDLRTGEQRTMGVRADGDQPGALLWRNDGGAIVATTSSLSFRGGADPPPDYVRVRTADVATGVVREVIKLQQTRFHPLTWSAKTHIITGAWIGEGGVQALYRLRDDGTLLSAVTGLRHYSAVIGSPAGESLLASYAYGESAHWYTGLHRLSAETLAVVAQRDVVDAEVIAEYEFRGMTDEIVGYTALASPVGTMSLQVFSADLKTVRSVWTAGASTASGSLHVRLDGSAAYLQAPSGWVRIDLDNGSTVPLPTNARGIPSGPTFYLEAAAIAKLATPTIAPTVSRASAVAQVRSLSNNVVRVDRIESKLVRFREIAYLDGAMAGVPINPNAPIWAVAVAGDVRAFSGAQQIAMKWGVWFIDAQGGAVVGFTGDRGQLATWPFFWDDLPDRG